MVSKNGLITARVFIWLTVAVIIAITCMACYAGSCNIRASSFDNEEQREGLINLYGAIFWGYPITFLGLVAGGAVIGLLTIADKHVRGMVPGNEKPTKNKEDTADKPDKDGAQ